MSGKFALRLDRCSARDIGKLSDAGRLFVPLPFQDQHGIPVLFVTVNDMVYISCQKFTQVSLLRMNKESHTLFPCMWLYCRPESNFAMTSAYVPVPTTAAVTGSWTVMV